jgi:hypothetical protein
MVDQNLFFITDSLEEFLSASQLFIVNAISIFGIVIKCGKHAIKLLPYMSCNISGHF